MNEDKVYPQNDAPKRRAKKTKAAKSKRAKRIVAGITIPIATVLVLFVSFFLFIFYSPWTTELRDQYILVTSSSSNPWLCTTFFSQKTIDQVLEANGSETPEGSIDPSLIDVNNPEETEETQTEEIEETVTEEIVEEKPPIEFKTSEEYPGEIIYDDGEVQIVKFTQRTNTGKYTARIIQVKDPSRVVLGVTNKLGKRGQLLSDFCTTNDALAAINAGGFVDDGGHGNGGTPLGTVIQNGIYTQYTKTTDHSIIGFDRNNLLVVGDFTEEECTEMGIRDAISWRPPSLLVLNGEIVEHRGLAGGNVARAGIGQCADGTVLLLVIDGSALRGIDGANFATMAKILRSYGAVNAANMDGGTSATMALEGKVINTVCNPAIAKRGRYLATCWLVKNLPDEAVTETTEN